MEDLPSGLGDRRRYPPKLTRAISPKTFAAFYSRLGNRFYFYALLAEASDASIVLPHKCVE